MPGLFGKRKSGGLVRHFGDTAVYQAFAGYELVGTGVEGQAAAIRVHELRGFAASVKSRTGPGKRRVALLQWVLIVGIITYDNERPHE